MDSLLTTLVLQLCALIIGVSKAGFGGGTGILVTPLMAQVMPAKTAVGVMLPLLLACDVFSLFYYWNRWDRRNLVAILPGALLGIILGTKILSLLSEGYFKKTIGIIACTFAILEMVRGRLTKSEYKFESRMWHGTIAGFATGTVSTLAHIGGVITSMYLLPQKLSNRAFVGTTTALYFTLNAVKLLPYWKLGMLTTPGLLTDVRLLPAILVGTIMGILLNRRISGKWFSRIVLIFVLITGIKLLF